MLIELKKEQYNKVYSVPQINLFPIIASVVYNIQDGKIFVDDVDTPSVIFIIHKSAFSFLHLSNNNINYSDILEFLYNCNDVPQYFHIYDVNDNIIAAAQNQKNINIKIRKRMRMNGKPQFDNFNKIAPEQYDVKSINQININELSVFNLSFIEKFWRSTSDFINKGFGWVIYHNNNPISIWYTLCVVNNNCETDILTLPEYRGKGFASITGFYILNSCMEKGINMDWDVFIDNIPSIKIGEKFGYKPYYNYCFLSIFKLKEQNNA